MNDEIKEELLGAGTDRKFPSLSDFGLSFLPFFGLLFPFLEVTLPESKELGNQELHDVDHKVWSEELDLDKVHCLFLFFFVLRCLVLECLDRVKGHLRTSSDQEKCSKPGLFHQ